MPKALCLISLVASILIVVLFLADEDLLDARFLQRSVVVFGQLMLGGEQNFPLAALVDKNVHIGSRTFGRGAVIMAVLGVLWVVPLILRVVFPWSRRGLSHLGGALVPPSPGRLRVEREPGARAVVGEHARPAQHLGHFWAVNLRRWRIRFGVDDGAGAGQNKLKRPTANLH